MFLELENISGKFQNNRKFQNNAINDVKNISLKHVISTSHATKLIAKVNTHYGSSEKFAKES